MNTTPARPGLHPMLWVAAASVTAVCLAGVAKLTGVLPDFGNHPAAPEAVATAPAMSGIPSLPAEPTPPTATAAAPAVEAPPPAPMAEPAPAPAPRAAAEHRHPAPKPHSRPAMASQPPAPVAAPNDAIPAPPPPGSNPRQVADMPPPVCRECGVVERVDAVQQKGEGTGLGAVGGAILGGVLGNQIGAGSGNKIARIGGAVLGGFAGNEVEKRARSVSHYRITVRMEDGTRRVIEQQSEPSWRSGDPVRVHNGEIVGGGAPRPTQGNAAF